MTKHSRFFWMGVASTLFIDRLLDWSWPWAGFYGFGLAMMLIAELIDRKTI